MLGIVYQLINEIPFKPKIIMQPAHGQNVKEVDRKNSRKPQNRKWKVNRIVGHRWGTEGGQKLHWGAWKLGTSLLSIYQWGNGRYRGAVQKRRNYDWNWSFVKSKE